MNLNDCVHLAIRKNFESRYIHEMTRKQLSEKMEISYSTVQRFFNDPEYTVDFNFLEAYATATMQSVRKVLLLVYREVEVNDADNGMEDEPDLPVYTQKIRELGLDFSTDM